MAIVVGVRFRRAGKVYYFDPAELELKIGEFVVVKTSRGMELGHIVVASREVTKEEVAEPLMTVVRKAEPDDIKRADELDAKAEESLIECSKLITELNLPMKLLAADYNLEGNRLVILFGAEERVDFRELVRRLAGVLKVRVELRQVGSRDEAKIVGGVGRCGRTLCCAAFLDDFNPVTIKMAKEQDLPLNPMKISGTCGRLMCCLGYENELYKEVKRKLPRVGQFVTTPVGEAKITGSNVLKETVIVQLESGATVELPLKDITVKSP